MKINIEWTETSYYCEEVEAPDDLKGEELDKWVKEIWDDEIWGNASSDYIDASPIKWHKA